MIGDNSRSIYSLTKPLVYRVWPQLGLFRHSFLRSRMTAMKSPLNSDKSRLFRYFSNVDHFDSLVCSDMCKFEQIVATKWPHEPPYFFHRVRFYATIVYDS